MSSQALEAHLRGIIPDRVAKCYTDRPLCSRRLANRSPNPAIRCLPRGTMQHSSLSTLFDNGVARCDACQWRCTLAAGDVGRCAVRHGDGEGVVPDNFGILSGAAVGPVEDHRLWHFFPDSLAFSIGSWGSSFPADQ